MRAFFIVDNLDGTIRTETEPSWNTPENKPNQLAKFDMDTDVLPTIPDVELLAWNGSQIIEAPQAAYDAAQASADVQDAAELERQSIPLIFDTPIEAQSFVFVSHSTGIGYEYFVDDAGDLLNIVAHASPLKSKEEREALKMQAKADHAQRRSDRTAEAQDIKSKVRGSGGWRALQAEVERLAALVEAMQ